MDGINWGGFGPPTRALFDGTMPGLVLARSGGGSTAPTTSATVKKMIDDAADATVAKADRATNLVNARLDQYYCGQKAMVSSVVCPAAEPGLLTTAATSTTAEGKISKYSPWRASTDFADFCREGPCLEATAFPT